MGIKRVSELDLGKVRSANGKLAEQGEPVSQLSCRLKATDHLHTDLSNRCQHSPHPEEDAAWGGWRVRTTDRLCWSVVLRLVSGQKALKAVTMGEVTRQSRQEQSCGVHWHLGVGERR